MANPLTFSPMAEEPAVRPAQRPQLPLPANAQPRATAAMQQFLASLPPTVRGVQQFRLDPDLALALEDMQQGSGEPWAQWLEKALNESLRMWLGR